jgi:hypothetical protein
MPPDNPGSLSARVLLSTWCLLALLLSATAALFAFPQQAHADITTDLVGWWKLDDGSGSTAVDVRRQGFRDI